MISDKQHKRVFAFSSGRYDKYIVFFVLFIFLLLPVGCIAPGIITVEVSHGLIDIADKGIANSDAAIIKANDQLYEIEMDLLQVEEVVSPAMQWIKHQESISREGSWQIEVKSEGLDQLKNDRYGITRLEIEIHPQGNRHFIEILDLETGKVYDMQTLEETLANKKGALEKEKQRIIADRELCSATLYDTLKYYSTWRVRKQSDGLYDIKGTALGWDQRFVNGNWTYRRETNNVFPIDESAKRLQNILLCR